MSSFRPAKRWARQRRAHHATPPLRAIPTESAVAPRTSEAAPPKATRMAPAPDRTPKPAAQAEGQNGKLRRNVGIVVRNKQGKILAGLRAHASGDKAWQLPQGGIEGRELPATAAYRELREETGIDPRAVKLVRELEHWIDYHLPADMTVGRRFVGQTQKWFLFEFQESGLPDLKKAIDKEFEQLAWVEMDWLIHHVIDFRKPVYKAVKKAFRL